MTKNNWSDIEYLTIKDQKHNIKTVHVSDFHAYSDIVDNYDLFVRRYFDQSRDAYLEYEPIFEVAFCELGILVLEHVLKAITKDNEPEDRYPIFWWRRGVPGSKRNWHRGSVYRHYKFIGAQRDLDALKYDEDAVEYNIRARDKGFPANPWRDDKVRADIDIKNWKRHRKTQYKGC